LTFAVYKLDVCALEERAVKITLLIKYCTSHSHHVRRQ